MIGQTATAWSADEIAWAKECLAAGDTLEEIAEASDRTVDEVRQALPSGPSITATEREVLRLYSAGVSLRDIDRGRGDYAYPGAAAGMVITALRRKGLSIPHRRADLQRTGASR